MKRAKIVAGVMAAAALLFAAGIAPASIPGAAGAKPAPTGTHWIAQHYDNVLIPAGSIPPIYTIGCTAGEVMLGLQSSAICREAAGPTQNFTADSLAQPLAYTAGQHQVVVPTSTLSYTVYGLAATPPFDETLTWTVAVLCDLERLRGQWLLTIDELADQFSVHRTTIKNWHLAGLLIAHKANDKNIRLFAPPARGDPRLIARQGSPIRNRVRTQPTPGGAV